MTTMLLLALLLALLAVLAASSAVILQRPSSEPDTRLATSTEGMKICPRCGMGNLWTERRCSACGNSLKG